MNKFKKLLSQGSDGIYERRVDALATQAEIAQQAIVNKLKQEKSKLEIELINLTDLSPETSDSLRPGDIRLSPSRFKELERTGVGEEHPESEAGVTHYRYSA